MTDFENKSDPAKKAIPLNTQMTANEGQIIEPADEAHKEGRRLTQMELIQSLGEALTWLQRETSWGVPATELRHLTGRIGELFVAVMTNGKMAGLVNQHGWDVISEEHGKISVKTTATISSSHHVSFNKNTLKEVDWITVLRINAEEQEIEVLCDKAKTEIVKLMGERSFVTVGELVADRPKTSQIKTISSVKYNEYTISELETGSIQVSKDGALQDPVKPILRDIAFQLNISLENESGNLFNTRQLGNRVIRRLYQHKSQSKN